MTETRKGWYQRRGCSSSLYTVEQSFGLYNLRFEHPCFNCRVGEFFSNSDGEHSSIATCLNSSKTHIFAPNGSEREELCGKSSLKSVQSCSYSGHVLKFHPTVPSAFNPIS